MTDPLAASLRQLRDEMRATLSHGIDILRGKLRDTASSAQAWQPAATAPSDRVVWFWVRPKTAAEAYCDTSGQSIFVAGPPRLFEGKRGSWSSLETATHWCEPRWPAPPPDAVV